MARRWRAEPHMTLLTESGRWEGRTKTFHDVAEGLGVSERDLAELGKLQSPDHPGRGEGYVTPAWLCLPEAERVFRQAFWRYHPVVPRAWAERRRFVLGGGVAMLPDDKLAPILRRRRARGWGIYRIAARYGIPESVIKRLAPMGDLASLTGKKRARWIDEGLGRGLSMREMARRLDISPSRVMQIAHRGRRKRDQAARRAAAAAEFEARLGRFAATVDRLVELTHGPA